jgi:hypothetical protein
MIVSLRSPAVGDWLSWLMEMWACPCGRHMPLLPVIDATHKKGMDPLASLCLR